ncbi:anthranilate synthase component 1 [Corynebacterium uropygiale]|uniref:Anthranilate synthase component 1 n=1 Tax=Corynebacterium uropygiale TaxID=1775911 RepID=A0A9X1U1J4_9CORY|nr:anthranilate synthase component 1 [Corynebacterium uropygiale]MCF4007653.1 anthranilate synthase component 1 [Corynebacterium uropygiale]
MTPPAHSAPRPEFDVLRREVAYREDASALFAHLGGTRATDSVLLESADVTTHSGITSVMVLRAALRVTCENDEVSAHVLTPTGQAMLRRLDSQIGEYRVPELSVEGHSVYRFPASEAIDERDRLKAVSTMEPLRRLQRDSGVREDPGAQGAAGALPFLAGGWAYDYLGTFEELPEVGASANTYPDYQFIAAEILLEINHEEHRAELSALCQPEDRARLEAELEELARSIADSPEEAAPTGAPAQATDPEAEPLQVRATISDEEFCSIVRDLQNDIEQGEIYQVVPARAFLSPCPDAFAAYRQLRATNPSPYMFYVRGTCTPEGERPYELFGASPESNVKYTAANREIQIYPVAGTRPRGLNPDGSVNHELDIRAELDMRTDAKELAEHVMLVDLARNDLARVAVPATRKVVDLLHVDRYSRVMHLVSRVVATLAEDCDALDAYRACMNMGTLTGAPKLRATELIRGVEKERRGSYGGAIGYLRGTGDMDTCIVIRSAFVQDGQAIVQAGAGVVRDSRPQSEADETLHKAYTVLNSLALAAHRPLEVIR